MPTPRRHGGAPLQYTPLNMPGFRGLNKQAVGALLGPEWATRLENTIIDDTGRLAARAGWTEMTTTTAAADDFLQLYEEATTEYIFGSGEDNKLYRSTDDGDTFTDVSGTATLSDAQGQFLGFNGYVLYAQSGERLAQYSGTTFTTVADVNCPTGGVNVAAFGRVWGVTSTGKSFRYSALLDHTDWTSADSGLIDMTSIWQADDTITGLADFNGSLVVFGKRNIVVFNDGQGSALGVDPLNLYVVDTMQGVGCVARDSIQSIDGDLWFLSLSGLMSFGRLIQEKSNPIKNVSRHVQDFLGVYQRGTDPATVRGVYCSSEKFYLLSFPAGVGTTETGVCFCFDTRQAAEDGSFRCAGIWNRLVPQAAYMRSSGDFIMAYKAQVGKVGLYGNYNDAAESYVVEYESGWSDWNDPHTKILKRINGIFFVGGTHNVAFKWAFDFDDSFSTATVTYTAGASASEYGAGEWSENEFNAGVLLREKSAAGRKSGEHIKIGITDTIDGAPISLQQISAYAKTGRLR